MSVPTIQVACNAGEISPSLYGRVDLEKYKKGTATLRNMFASYRGGAISRAGTKFCGICKQGNKGLALTVPPPRNITFQYSVTQGIAIEAGDNYFRFLSNGGYITETPKAITAVSNANPCVIRSVAHGYANGNEVYIAGINAPLGVRLNDRSYEVENVTTDTFTLVNVLDGISIDTTPFHSYTGGGTVARIYTLATPYSATDLPWLKFAESADTMTLTLVNQDTGSEYPPYDLVRISPANWTLTRTTFFSSVSPPASINVTQTHAGTTMSFFYQFLATAVDAKTGEESIASPSFTIVSVDQAAIAGSFFISCAPVTRAGSYNFYGAPETYLGPPVGGQFFGYLGSSFGPAFTDTNVVPDYAVGPPMHTDPFATSSVLALSMTADGSNYDAVNTTVTVPSPIGDNAVLLPVVLGGGIISVTVQNGGAGYTGGETITFSGGTGSGAAALLHLSPATGTFPGVVSYFQQRRFYANTLNQPDTYFASQPGAFNNMDTSNPSAESDAIVGSPWSQQVNGIQWMLNMPGGLVVLTGLGAWQLSGAGGGLATSAAITPANQVASPQAFNGASPKVPPIPINYDILYNQEKGSIIRDLSYNFFVNIYTGTDLTVLSNHLFDGFTVVQWGWAEEPNKLLWVIRNDGVLLCLTYLKEQDVYAWSRHDTDGLYVSVCTVSEPPVNAPYFVVQRAIAGDNGNSGWVYFQERMDNRLWTGQTTAWCVDAGLSYAQNAPNAFLSVSEDDGVPTLQQPALVYGGERYSAETYARIADPTGKGAVPLVEITSGVIVSASVSGTLIGYTNPQFVVTDPTGAGGNATINIASRNIITLAASSGVFQNLPGMGEAGDIVNMGLRRMAVTAYLSSTRLTGYVLKDQQPAMRDDAPRNFPVPVSPGNWTIAAPISVVHGLDHLEGMLVSILADGIVVAPQVVIGGAVKLPQPATSIVVGLGFQAQMQTLYLDVQGPVTVQGRRKEVDSVVVRINRTGVPFDVGVNQPDAAIQPGFQDIPWSNMTPVQGVVTGSSTPLQPYSLNTDDVFVDVFDMVGGTFAQVAVQQLAPLPLEVLAIVPFTRIQDDPDAA